MIQLKDLKAKKKKKKHLQTEKNEEESDSSIMSDLSLVFEDDTKDL